MSTTAKADKKISIKGDKKKKVDSPEQSQSPINYEAEEIQIKAIDGADIQALAIKEEDLTRVRQQRRPTPPTNDESLVVKKKNKHFYPTDEVKVAKLVPNKGLKPIDVSDHLGLKLDNYGNCVPHSILGTIDDYFVEMKASGKTLELPFEEMNVIENDEPVSGVYDKNATKSKNTDGGTKALENWQNKMLERKRTQGFISKLVNRPPEQLVMNQADNARRFNEIKTLIDRTLPLVEYGKGYRLGNEFWSQTIQLGRPETGITTTLKQSEKGNLPHIEHISKPSNALLETELTSNNQPSTVHYPWDKSRFLKRRLNQLDPLIKEIDPHYPDFSKLEVVSTIPQLRTDTLTPAQKSEDTWVNPEILYKSSVVDDTTFLTKDEKDPLSEYPDVSSDIVYGPAIVFGGQMARWTGDDGENSGIIALESRLNFETKAGKRVTATFEIVNCGTTAVYFDWRKIPVVSAFDIVNAKTQRFYFDTRSNVILPGDQLKINFVFKSKKGGVFTEKWEFLTEPKLLSGASLILTLRGIAIQEDKFRKHRAYLEEDLMNKEAQMIASEMLEIILNGVRTPERPASPDDAYITEEETFLRFNPNLYYDHDVISELRVLYSELFDEQERRFNQWDLSIYTLKEKILDLPENDERKQDLLRRLNTHLNSLTFQPYAPVEFNMYNTCYNLLSQTIDDLVSEMYNLRTYLHLPVPTEEIYPFVDKFNQDYEDWRKDFEVFKQQETERKNRLEKEKGKDKGKKGADKKDDKKKEVEKKKSTPTPNTAGKAKQLSKSPSRAPSEREERKTTVSSSIALTEDQKAVEQIYLDNAYNIGYQLLVRMFDNMDQILYEQTQNVDVTSKLGQILTEPKFITPKFSDYID